MIKMWKTFGFIVLLSSTFSWAQNPDNTQQDQYNIFLKYNEKTPFIFMGKIDVNKVNAAGGGMLYPGGNALVFFTAVLTHAAINSSVDNSRASKEQVEANKVFDDYQPYIQKFNSSENIIVSDINVGSTNGKVKFLTDAASKAEAEWEMDVAPIFFMTQNSGSLILYNKIVLQDAVVGDVKKTRRSTKGTKKKAVNKNERIVVVISDPIAEPDFKIFWSNNEGDNFYRTLKKMYKESLSLVIANRIDNQKAENAEQITVKYMEDGEKKVERGYVISSDCRRTLFESLEGEIKSVPNLDFLNCPPSV